MGSTFKKLSRFEMASHHRAAPCLCEKAGEPCSERGHLCVLFLCSICGLAEGSLTSECPGHKVASDKEDRVLAGEIDYRKGEWITWNWR
jgi:hypothetical protein